jgi:hypothetical protein
MRLADLTSREIKKISGSSSINTYDDRGSGGGGNIQWTVRSLVWILAATMSVVNCSDFKAVLSFGIVMLLRCSCRVLRAWNEGIASGWNARDSTVINLKFCARHSMNCWLYVSPPLVLNPSRPALFHDHFHSFTIWNPRITLSKMHEHIWYFGKFVWNFIWNLQFVFSVDA